MRKPFNPRPMSNGAMAVAILALCVAMAGSAFAGAKFGKGTVKTENIHKGAVTTKKLRNGAVTSNKLAAGVVKSEIAISRQAGVTLSVPAGQSRVGIVGCPVGSQAISAGAALVNATAGDDDLGIVESAQLAGVPRFWSVRVGNSEAAMRSWQLSAICIRIG
jgi:hypothetical protein